jgi:hypothetical protein
MPQGTKYSTTPPTSSLKRDNVVLGIAGNLGPTATTGFYSTPIPQYGKYMIIKVSPSGIPNFFAPQNNNDLINFARSEGATGPNTGSVDALLSWISSQTNLEVINFEYENIVTDGLVLNLDSGFTAGYPSTGTALYDLSGNSNNVTLTNGIGFVPSGSDYDGSGALRFDGIDDYVPFYAPNLGTIATVEMWCKIDGGNYSHKMFMGWGLYDIYCYGGAIGFNTANSDCYGISLNTVNTLGITNQWAHYIFEFRTDVSYTNNKIYINGVLQSLSQLYSSENPGARNFSGGSGRIASWGAGGYYMPMDCAIFRVYNRALTQAEVTQNYNAQKGRFQNFYPNGNFQFLTAGGALQNFTNGAIANNTTKLDGYNYSCQMTLPQYNTFQSNNYVQVDTTKTYVMTVKNRTLTKGGTGNNILSGGHTGYITYDSSFRFIDLRNCGGVANTYLTRDLNPGDAYAYVSNQNNQWYPANSEYYFRHFMIYPPGHPEFNKPWEYTRIGFPDPEIYYNEITDIGGGELRIRFSNYNGSSWTTFPSIGYATPAGTAVMNGVAGGTYSYVFYPTEAPYGSWATYTSDPFTGENRNSGTPFRYATKYITFMHLVNYAIPGGTSPAPVMLFGDVTLEQVK